MKNSMIVYTVLDWRYFCVKDNSCFLHGSYPCINKNATYK